MSEQSALQSQSRGHSGINANTLKAIAIAAMVVDHFASVFLPHSGALYYIMRCIGRITGPTMFYFIAEGYHHTSNANRYTIRLAIFAAVSYIPYIYCLHPSGQRFLPDQSNFMDLNVIFTLLMGLLAVRARHEVKNPVLKWVLIGLAIAVCTKSDWNYFGIIAILAFDYFYGDFNKQAFAYSMLTLVYILPSLTYPITALLSGTVPDPMKSMQNLYRLGMFIPILLLKHYNGKLGSRNKFIKWSFYIIYPAHLMIFGLISHYLV